MRALLRQKWGWLTFVVLVVASFMLLMYAQRGAFASGFLHVGNAFFGGVLPYNLVLADASYRAALAFDPNVEDAWHQRARIAFLKGDFSNALAMINMQISLHGDSLMAAYYIRGLIYGYAKNYVMAERDFQKYVTWNPGNWAGNNDLAWVYFVQGKFEESKKQTEHGLAAFPSNPWLLVAHAMSLYNLGDAKNAEMELFRARDEAAKLNEKDWNRAYPGNDPAIGSQGLKEFKDTIEKNIELVHSKAFVL